MKERIPKSTYKAFHEALDNGEPLPKETATVIANAMKTNNLNTVATSSGTEKLFPIYNVQTQDKKISLTMNCAWNADDVDKILEILNQNNVKITFFMVGDWIDKYPEAVKKINEAGQEIRKS